jgi:hypothetical protein
LLFEVFFGLPYPRTEFGAGSGIAFIPAYKLGHNHYKGSLVKEGCFKENPSRPNATHLPAREDLPHSVGLYGISNGLGKVLRF